VIAADELNEEHPKNPSHEKNFFSHTAFHTQLFPHSKGSIAQGLEGLDEIFKIARRI